MNMLFLLSIVCISMVAYGRDSIRTSTKSQLQISPTNIKMDSEDQSSINDNYILYVYPRKNSAAKVAYDPVNKRLARTISTQKVKKSNKIEDTGLNILNRISENTILKKIFQIVLIRPKLRPCPIGMVRDNRSECVLKFFDD